MNVDSSFQSRCAALVEREVYVCLSSLVSTLAHGSGWPAGGASTGALPDLCDQALELCAPVLDYEGAAREAGFTVKRFGDVERVARDTRKDGSYPLSSRRPWENACEDHDIEPHELEVFEHWAVSNWLADKLEAKGERIDRDFAGMTVWARTTTGQAISIDGVIEDIVREIEATNVA